MAGLRVFRSLRVPFLTAREDRAVARQDPARRAADADRLRRALLGRYDAVHSHEEGGVIGVVLAALMRVPHVYDMHSSLPQQLTNFAFTSSPLVRGVFLVLERMMIRRSRVVIVICPSLEETVRGIDAGRADRADRKRTGIGRGSGRRRRPAAAVRQIARRRRADADRPLHRHVRGLPGARPAVRRDGDRAAARARTRGWCSRAGSRIRWQRAREQARRGGHRRRHGLCRRAPRRRRFPPICSPPTCWCRRARAAPTRRSRSISTFARAKPIVATRLLTHTQVLDDDTAVLTGASTAGIRGRHPGGA